MHPWARKYGNGREEVISKEGGEESRSVRVVCDVYATQVDRAAVDKIEWIRERAHTHACACVCVRFDLVCV